MKMLHTTRTTAYAARGFTPIELMIAMAISAVLLALAIPAYQDYTIRAKVAEGLSLAGPAKLALAETCQSDPSLDAVDAAMIVGEMIGEGDSTTLTLNHGHSHSSDRAPYRIQTPVASHRYLLTCRNKRLILPFRWWN